MEFSRKWGEFCPEFRQRIGKGPEAVGRPRGVQDRTPSLCGGKVQGCRGVSTRDRTAPGWGPALSAILARWRREDINSTEETERVWRWSFRGASGAEGQWNPIHHLYLGLPFQLPFLSPLFSGCCHFGILEPTSSPKPNTTSPSIH